MSSNSNESNKQTGKNIRNLVSAKSKYDQNDTSRTDINYSHSFVKVNNDEPSQNALELSQPATRLNLGIYEAIPEQDMEQTMLEPQYNKQLNTIETN